MGKQSKPLTLLVCLATFSFGSSSAILLSPDDTDAKARIENADSGAVFTLLPGTFTSLCDVSIRRDLHLRSVNGSESTRLDCGRNARHFQVRGEVTFHLEGVSLNKGTSEKGGCVAAEPFAILVITRCAFQECSSDDGGAVHSAQSSSVHISHSTFRDIAASQSGGAFYVGIHSLVTVADNCFFADITAGKGGIANVVSGEIELSHNITIESCDTYEEGGVLRLWHSKAVIRHHVTIRDCSTRDGVLEMYESEAEISDGVLVEKVDASLSGFVYAHDDSFVSIQRNVVVRDVAAFDSGGCLFMDGSDLVVADNVSFSCQSGWLAGGIYVENAEVEMSGGVTFEGCSAAQAGGAMVLGGAHGWLDNVHFSHNWATHIGGAMYLWGEAEMYLSHATFISSVARDSGGALAVEGDSYVEAADIVAIDSSASGAGGFLYMHSRSTVFLERAHVEGAYALKKDLPDVALEESGVGGAVFVADFQLFQAINSTFRDCHAENSGGLMHVDAWFGENEVFLVDCHVAESSAREGGAMFLQWGYVSVIGGTFEGCEATEHGGMTYATADYLLLEGVTVRACRAGGDGGGVFDVGLFETDVYWSAFIGNQANGSGGAIAQHGAELYLSDSTLVGNNASDGGCVHVSDYSRMWLRDSLLSDCRASGRGGGIFIDMKAKARLYGRMHIVGNSAWEGGGVCVSDADLVNYGTSHVSLNSASGAGGGVLSSGGEVRIRSGSAILDGNQAETGGGYCGRGALSTLKMNWGLQLQVSNCSASLDGGGVALSGGATVQVYHWEKCPAECLADDACQPECLTPACNFDHGHCRERFEQAGRQALAACDRSTCSVEQEQSPHSCSASCLHAGCDWSASNQHCRESLDALLACPLFDSAAYHSTLAQPRVTYVQAGSVRGFGRCVDADCAATGHSCVVVDDGGRVLEFAANNNNTVIIDRGEANGTCSDKPRLPSSGFAYDEEEMRSIANMSGQEILSQYPGCGSHAIVVRFNSAGRNGGGWFQASCEASTDALPACFVGGMEPGTHATVVSVEHNTATDAGGGVFSQCEELGPCRELAALGLGWPSVATASRPRRAESTVLMPVLSVSGNVAGGYGGDMASLAADMHMQAAQTTYVAGIDLLDLQISLADREGQQVQVASSRQALESSLFIEFLSGANNASAVALPALTVPVPSLPLRTAELGVVLPSCPRGRHSMTLVLSLVGGSFDTLPSPHQSVNVTCLPCPDGFAMEQTEHGWSCVRCPATHYVINSTDPTHRCEPCPLGLECDGTSAVHARVSLSEWEAEAGVMMLRHCPTGYEVAPSVESRTAGFDAALQRCEVCGVGRQCVDAQCTECAACPAGFHKARAGTQACALCGENSYANTTGAAGCTPCADQASTNGSLGSTAPSACVCDHGYYAAAVEELRCVECPLGAKCQATGGCMLGARPARCGPEALLGLWEVDNSTGEYVLSECPDGFDAQRLSAVEQQCLVRVTPAVPAAPLPPPPSDKSSSLPMSVVLGMSLGGGALVLVLVSVVAVYLRRVKRQQTDALAELRRRVHPQHSTRNLVPPSDAIDRARKGDERAASVIFEMFPRHIAEAMVRGDEKLAEDRSEACAVFFSDIVGFTNVSSQLDAAQVNAMLDRLFEQFDRLALTHGVYKIDTIGDCYIGVTHLVLDQAHQHSDQVARMAAFSLDAVAAATSTLIDPADPSKGHVRIRVGFDVGPVVGHVQGKRQKKYTIFGNTVNTASRMESTGEAGRVQCTAGAAARLREQDGRFVLRRRGEVEVKGRGTMETFFVEGREEREGGSGAGMEGGQEVVGDKGGGEAVRSQMVFGDGDAVRASTDSLTRQTAGNPSASVVRDVLVAEGALLENPSSAALFDGPTPKTATEKAQEIASSEDESGAGPVRSRASLISVSVTPSAAIVMLSDINSLPQTHTDGRADTAGWRAAGQVAAPAVIRPLITHVDPPRGCPSPKNPPQEEEDFPVLTDLQVDVSCEVLEEEASAAFQTAFRREKEEV